MRSPRYWFERIGGFGHEKLEHPARSRTSGKDAFVLDESGGVAVRGPISRGPVRLADPYVIAAGAADRPVKACVGAGPLQRFGQCQARKDVPARPAGGNCHRRGVFADRHRPANVLAVATHGVPHEELVTNDYGNLDTTDYSAPGRKVVP